MEKRPARVPAWLIAAVVLTGLTLALLKMPRDAFWRYSWVVFPGVFIAAALGRVVEEQLRRRRRERFRKGR